MSLDAIGELIELEILELENTKLISKYDFLEKLDKLKGLGLSGSMWTTLKIDTIQPIRNLTNLVWLDLGNTKILDLDFKPIFNLKNLVSLYIPLWYSRSTYKELYKELPNLKYGEIEKIVKDDEYCKQWSIK